MGILKGIFKSRDKPKNATSGSAYRFFIGGSSIGKNVNERSVVESGFVQFSFLLPFYYHLYHKSKIYLSAAVQKHLLQAKNHLLPH